MKKITTFFAAAAICAVFVCCGNKPAAQAVQATEQEKAEVLKNEPEDILKISNDFLNLLKASHISNNDDANNFKEKLHQFEDQLSAFTKAINDKIKTMDEKEKEKFVARIEEAEKKIEKNNSQVEKEMDRLDKEAKAIGVELDLNFNTSDKSE